MIVNLHDAQVIGALRAVKAKASFSRARIVLRTAASESLSVVQDYFPAEEPSADVAPISPDDWKHLQSTDQALSLPHPQPALSGLAVWLFRLPANNPSLKKWHRQLKQKGALRHSWRMSSATVLLVNEIVGNPLRDLWTREAYDEAWSCAQKGRWPAARERIEMSWLLDRYRMLQRTALYVLILEKLGRKADADDLIALERNSVGVSTTYLRSIVSSLQETLKCNTDKSSANGEGWFSEVSDGPTARFSLSCT